MLILVAIQLETKDFAGAIVAIEIGGALEGAFGTKDIAPSDRTASLIMGINGHGLGQTTAVTILIILRWETFIPFLDIPTKVHPTLAKICGLDVVDLLKK